MYFVFCLLSLSVIDETSKLIEEKERMGLNFDNDGEWWMSYRLSLNYCFDFNCDKFYMSCCFPRDFAANFDQFEMCSISPDSLGDCQTDECVGRWSVNSWHGKKTLQESCFCLCYYYECYFMSVSIPGTVGLQKHQLYECYYDECYYMSVLEDGVSIPGMVV